MQCVNVSARGRPMLFKLFLPFAFGYFLSFLYRVVNVAIAPDLVQEFGLNANQSDYIHGDNSGPSPNESTRFFANQNPHTRTKTQIDPQGKKLLLANSKLKLVNMNSVLSGQTKIKKSKEFTNQLQS